MTKAVLAGVVFLVACGKSTPSSSESVKAKATEAVKPDVAAQAPAQAAPATLAADKCGDGKIKTFSGAEIFGTEYTLYCKDSGIPAIKGQTSNVDDNGKAVVKEVSIETWNAIWALAEKENWKTAKTDCPPAEEVEGRQMVESLTINQAGKKFDIQCDNEAPAQWNDLRAAIIAAGPTDAPPPPHQR